VSSLADVKKALRDRIDPAKAEFFPRFFKSNPGDYGEGDKFLGIMVPQQRAISKLYKDLALNDVITLLQSPYHEERLTALFILVLQFQKGDEPTRQKIYDLYLANTKYVNNWDLVDSSAEFIVGPWLEDKLAKMKVLQKLAKSSMLWERRIAMLATFHYIKGGQYKDGLTIAEMLVHDKHDLIQKAVGWMLREIGNRSLPDEEKFLKKYAATMPRTALRYAIEKFPPATRKLYMEAKNG